MMVCKWLRKAEEDLVVAGDELGKIPWVSASIPSKPPRKHSKH